jgi:hypothetical protein
MATSRAFPNRSCKRSVQSWDGYNQIQLRDGPESAFVTCRTSALCPAADYCNEWRIIRTPSITKAVRCLQSDSVARKSVGSDAGICKGRDDRVGRLGGVGLKWLWGAVILKPMSNDPPTGITQPWKNLKPQAGYHLRLGMPTCGPRSSAGKKLIPKHIEDARFHVRIMAIIDNRH